MIKAIEKVKPIGVLVTRDNQEHEATFPEEFARNEDGSVISIDELIDSVDIEDKSVKTESLFTESQVLDIIEQVTQRVTQGG